MNTTGTREQTYATVEDVRSVFRYRAADFDGSIRAGHIDAIDRGAARRLLLDQGLLPIALELAGTAAIQRASIPVRELALGLRVLGDLLDAGLPVSRALRAFEDFAPPSWRGAIPHLQQAIDLRPTYPEAHFNLARAYAATHQLEAAIRAATVAEAQADEAGKRELTARIRDQLRLYRAAVKR